MIQQMLTIWFLVSLPFLNLAWTSGSSQFTYCWHQVSQLNETKFDSEAKECCILWSKNGEMELTVSGVSSPWKAMGRAALLGSVSREGVELWRDSHRRAAHAPDHTVFTHSLPLPAWIVVSWAALLHMAGVEVFAEHSCFTLGTLVWSSGDKVSASHILWTNET